MMHFARSAEQQLLKDSVDKFVEREYGFDRRQSMLVAHQDCLPEHWAAFADLGWLAVAAPEAAGGLGGSAADTALICERLGRGLVLEPYLACGVTAIDLLVRVLGADAAPLIGPALEGKAKWTFAHAEGAARGRPACVAARAVETSGEFVLSGHKAVVWGAPVADNFIVSARTGGEPPASSNLTLFTFSREELEGRLTCYRTIDGRRVADLDLNGLTAPASALIGGLGSAKDAVEANRDHALIHACADAVGAMEQALWITRDYVVTREQFGAPLSSFQALQHIMAEMLIEVEQSRSMLYRGLASLGSESSVRLREAAACKIYISKAAQFVAQSAIQLHGAIGLTDEYAISHYFKRLTAFAASSGSVDTHFDAFRSSICN